MNELQQLLEAAANLWGQETIAAILRQLDSYPIQFNGTLRRSIMYEENEPFNFKFLMADYGQFQDEGVDGMSISHNSPYKFKGNWRGTAYFIKPWADAKGFNNFALAKKIQRDGIKPRPFFKNVIETRLPDLSVALNDTYQNYLNQAIQNAQNAQ